MFGTRALATRGVMLVAAFSGVVIYGATADEPARLGRTEIARRGKASTVLIDNGAGSFGTGFCVHPDGLFLTNLHVIRERPGKLKVSYVAGRKGPSTAEAVVIREDAKLDLALLRAEQARGLPALPLGDSDALEELTEVVILGYPFGRGFAAGKDVAPAVSINMGTISSLREKEGTLDRIQIDAGVNPGNSGGPVLSLDGSVVGVIVSRVEANFGAGVNLAIPVNLIRRFLDRPDIEFVPPTIEPSGVEQPVAFVARVSTFLPSAEPDEVELVIEAPDRAARHFPMKKGDDGYRAEAPPSDRPLGPRRVRLEARFADGSIVGVTPDRNVRVGTREIALREIRTIRRVPKAEVDLAEGTTSKDTSVDLTKVPMRLGGQDLEIDLARASSIEIDSADDFNAIACTVVARRQGKELASVTAPAYLAGERRPSMDAIREARFIRPPRSIRPASYLKVVSTPGDYIGQGRTYDYEGSALKLTGDPRGARIQVGDFGNWSIGFCGPERGPLVAGEYRDAKRLPFCDDAPGIEFSGNGRGCNTILGHFRVWEYEVKGNQVIRLAVDFVQHCEGQAGAIYGMLRYNSTYQ